MTDKKHNLESELKKWLSKARKIVIAGIGNPIRMDDFVGVKIVQNLRGKVSEKVYLIECETVPESFIQQIIDFNPTHILLVDAAILNLKPGEAKLLHSENLATFPAFSTHVLPLRVFCEYVSKATGAKIALLLIQPKNAEFGEGLTREVEASAKKIADLLFSALS
ncbi:MAG: hydrogenase 3 maturation endopeptidase HyCI [Candidatus Bathyarchaeia archaeon]